MEKAKLDKYDDIKFWFKDVKRLIWNGEPIRKISKEYRIHFPDITLRSFDGAFVYEDLDVIEDANKNVNNLCDAIKYIEGKATDEYKQALWQINAGDCAYRVLGREFVKEVAIQDYASASNPQKKKMLSKHDGIMLQKAIFSHKKSEGVTIPATDPDFAEMQKVSPQTTVADFINILSAERMARDPSLILNLVSEDAIDRTKLSKLAKPVLISEGKKYYDPALVDSGVSTISPRVAGAILGTDFKLVTAQSKESFDRFFGIMGKALKIKLVPNDTLEAGKFSHNERSALRNAGRAAIEKLKYRVNYRKNAIEKSYEFEYSTKGSKDEQIYSVLLGLGSLVCERSFDVLENSFGKTGVLGVPKDAAEYEKQKAHIKQATASLAAAQLALSFLPRSDDTDVLVQLYKLQAMKELAKIDKDNNWAVSVIGSVLATSMNNACATPMFYTTLYESTTATRWGKTKAFIAAMFSKRIVSAKEGILTLLKGNPTRDQLDAKYGPKALFDITSLTSAQENELKTLIGKHLEDKFEEVKKRDILEYQKAEAAFKTFSEEELAKITDKTKRDEYRTKWAEASENMTTLYQKTCIYSDGPEKDRYQDAYDDIFNTLSDKERNEVVDYIQKNPKLMLKPLREAVETALKDVIINKNATERVSNATTLMGMLGAYDTARGIYTTQMSDRKLEAQKDQDELKKYQETAKDSGFQAALMEYAARDGLDDDTKKEIAEKLAKLEKLEKADLSDLISNHSQKVFDVEAFYREVIPKMEEGYQITKAYTDETMDCGDAEIRQEILDLITEESKAYNDVYKGFVELKNDFNEIEAFIARIPPESKKVIDFREADNLSKLHDLIFADVVKGLNVELTKLKAETPKTPLKVEYTNGKIAAYEKELKDINDGVSKTFDTSVQIGTEDVVASIMLLGSGDYESVEAAYEDYKTIMVNSGSTPRADVISNGFKLFVEVAKQQNMARKIETEYVEKIYNNVFQNNVLTLSNDETDFMGILTAKIELERKYGKQQLVGYENYKKFVEEFDRVNGLIKENREVRNDQEKYIDECLKNIFTVKSYKIGSADKKTEEKDAAFEQIMNIVELETIQSVDLTKLKKLAAKVQKDFTVVDFNSKDSIDALKGILLKEVKEKLIEEEKENQEIINGLKAKPKTKFIVEFREMNGKSFKQEIGYIETNDEKSFVGQRVEAKAVEILETMQSMGIQAFSMEEAYAEYTKAATSAVKAQDISLEFANTVAAKNKVLFAQKFKKEQIEKELEKQLKDNNSVQKDNEANLAQIDKTVQFIKEKGYVELDSFKLLNDAYNAIKDKIENDGEDLKNQERKIDYYNECVEAIVSESEDSDLAFEELLAYEGISSIKPLDFDAILGLETQARKDVNRQEIVKRLSVKKERDWKAVAKMVKEVQGKGLSLTETIKAIENYKSGNTQTKEDRENIKNFFSVFDYVSGLGDRVFEKEQNKIADLSKSLYPLDENGLKKLCEQNSDIDGFEKLLTWLHIENEDRFADGFDSLSDKLQEYTMRRNGTTRSALEINQIYMDIAAAIVDSAAKDIENSKEMSGKTVASTYIKTKKVNGYEDDMSGLKVMSKKLEPYMVKERKVVSKLKRTMGSSYESLLLEEVLKAFDEYRGLDEQTDKKLDELETKLKEQIILANAGEKKENKTEIDLMAERIVEQIKINAKECEQIEHNIKSGLPEFEDLKNKVLLQAKKFSFKSTIAGFIVNDGSKEDELTRLAQEELDDEMGAYKASPLKKSIIHFSSVKKLLKLTLNELEDLSTEATQATDEEIDADEIMGIYVARRYGKERNKEPRYENRRKEEWQRGRKHARKVKEEGKSSDAESVKDSLKDDLGVDNTTFGV